MKRRLLLGVVMVLSAMLMLSCNKNRFDFDNLESVEGSGQWKLPIGNASISLGDVMKQFNDNGLVQTDEQGNLLIHYAMTMDEMVKGSTFLKIGTLNFDDIFEFPNPLPGVPLPEPIDTVVYFSHHLKMTNDSARLETVVLKTGTLVVSFVTNLGDITEIDLSSPDITFAGTNDTLNEKFTSINHSVDLAGATFRLVDPVTGEQDSVFVLNYAIHYRLSGIDDPTYEIKTLIGLIDFEIQEISGYIDAFQYDFSLDTTFALPIGNVNGQMSLVDANVIIKQKNTFGNLSASLFIDQAEFYGNGVSPLPIFESYPTMLSITPSPTYTPAFNEDLDLTVSTQHDGVRVAGRLDFNPNSTETLLTIYDTSSLGLSVEATVPMRFNIPGVTYVDTLDVNMGEVSAPEFVEKIVLHIMFDSELPFNLDAQFFTFNSSAGQITGELLDEELLIKGSFDGTSVPSEASVTITHDRLKQFLDADKLIMHFGVDTGGHDIDLNLDNGMGLTLKADVYYGGSLDLKN